MGNASPKTKTSAGRKFGISTIWGSDTDIKETAYMTRMWIGRLRFHIFHRGDQDPDCHDHPWGFWTFPLRSYVEEVLAENVQTYYGTKDTPPDVVRYFTRYTQVVEAFRLHYRPATHKHRVLGAYKGLDPNGDPLWASPGTIPTIVWTEKPSRAWGFTIERLGRWCWTPWRDYVALGGKDAPCQDEAS